MKIFLLALLIIFSFNSFGFSSERIGGWGAFHFGMKQSQIDVLLSMECEISARDKHTEVFSEGRNCGVFLDEKYDLSIHTSKEWWEFNRRTIIIKLLFNNNETTYKKIINYYSNKWEKVDYYCSKVLNSCTTKFGQSSDIVVNQPSYPKSKIEVMFIDRAYFN